MEIDENSLVITSSRQTLNAKGMVEIARTVTARVTLDKVDEGIDAVNKAIENLV